MILFPLRITAVPDSNSCFRNDRNSPAIGTDRCVRLCERFCVQNVPTKSQHFPSKSAVPVNNERTRLILSREFRARRIQIQPTRSPAAYTVGSRVRKRVSADVTGFTPGFRSQRSQQFGLRSVSTLYRFVCSSMNEDELIGIQAGPEQVLQT